MARFTHFLLKYPGLLIVLLLTFAYIITFSTLSILRHNAFFSSFDLANMDQTIWNTLHGKFFSLSAEHGQISRLSIHADFILIFLTPLYLFWDNVRILLISKSLLLGLGALPVYAISLKLIRNKFVSVIVVTSYLLNPGMQWSDIYDFHGVVFAIPFLLMAFYYSLTRKWKHFALFVFLALTTKEEISLFVALLGISVIFVRKHFLIGAATFFAGIAWFICTNFVLIPMFSPSGQHWALPWYSVSNTSGQGLVASLTQSLTHLTIDHSLFTTISAYLVILLKPFGFLPLLGLPWLLLSGPEIAINLLSSNSYMRSLTFHYDSGVTPGLIIGTIYAFKYLSDFLSRKTFTRKLTKPVLWLFSLYQLTVSLRVNYHYSPLPTTPSNWWPAYQVTPIEIEFEQLLTQIPSTASVAASSSIRPHLTHRFQVYNFPEGVNTADYIAILTEERVVGSLRKIELEEQLVTTLSSSPHYSLVKNLGNFYLFKKNV